MKKIGVASATAVGLGAIIGAGIFVLSGTAKKKVVRVRLFE